MWLNRSPPPSISQLSLRRGGLIALCPCDSGKERNSVVCSSAEVASLALDSEELGSLSRLLSVVSTAPDIVAISGCAVDLIKTVDHHPAYPRGVQSCFRFELLDLRTLMHKRNYSVFGHIDMFSVLQSLIVSLGGCLSEDWVSESPELVRVSLVYALGLHYTGRGW